MMEHISSSMNILLTSLRASAASTITFLVLLLITAGIVSAQRHACPNPTSFSIPAPQCPIDGKRNAVEYAQLMKRLDRKKGKWDKHHPRWELLEALYAYDTYEQNAGDEIRRYEGLYKHVPAKHKKVSLRQSLFSPLHPQYLTIKTAPRIHNLILQNLPPSPLPHRHKRRSLPTNPHPRPPLLQHNPLRARLVRQIPELFQQEEIPCASLSSLASFETSGAGLVE